MPNGANKEVNDGVGTAVNTGQECYHFINIVREKMLLNFIIRGKRNKQILKNRPKNMKTTPAVAIVT